MKKWMMIPVLAGAVIISGIGIVANAEQSGAVTQKDLLTMDGAKAIAVKTVGGQVTKIELDREVNQVTSMKSRYNRKASNMILISMRKRAKYCVRRKTIWIMMIKKIMSSLMEITFQKKLLLKLR